MVENVHDFAVYTKDLEGRTLSWNPGVERLLDYSEAEWVGLHVSAIFTQEDIERGEPDGEMRTALVEGRAEDTRWHVRNRRDGHLVLIVGDDGKGFEPGEAADGERGMGLLSMRERAEQVGGTLEIESGPGVGTTVYVRVPIA